MTLATAVAPRRWKKPPLIRSAWLRWTLIVGFVVYLALVAQTTPVNWARVWEGLPRGAAFVGAFFPPDFVSRWQEIVEGISESLWMTVVSTVVGIALSIPVGIGAAKNIAPAPVYYFCRAVLAVSRSFQEVILAIFFVKLFGFGPFAGFVTLSFATIGFYGKLLAEDIEDMDPTQAEAVRSSGASWLQWINYGVQPQVMPRMIGLGLYRFDINFRESAVIGIVGGGGIGATLNTAFDRYEFDFAAAIILVIIGIVMLCEYGPVICGGGCNSDPDPGARANLATARAAHPVVHLGRLAVRCRSVHWVLPDDFRQDHLGLCLGRAATGRRSRRTNGAAGLALYPRPWSADLGHNQYRHGRHIDRRSTRHSGCVLRRA